jgi:DNA-binding NarL/FixJ family response regulator
MRGCDLVADGYCDKEIAKRLKLSPSTIPRYVKRIAKRLGCDEPVRLIPDNTRQPRQAAPPPNVAHAQMAIRRQRASRWLRERAKRKGMKGLVAAIRRVA